MEETARITINGAAHDFPVITGTEDEKAIDISTLRGKTSYITLDSGFGNTGACTSGITFLDGEKGILRYRGIPIEELAERSTFLETSYLLIKGELGESSSTLLMIFVRSTLCPTFAKRKISPICKLVVTFARKVARTSATTLGLRNVCKLNNFSLSADNIFCWRLARAKSDPSPLLP